MKCEEIREVMPDLASGLMEVTPEIGGHLAGCGACAAKMEEFRQTMALLDEWKAPEPSPYFDVRLQARLREEMAKPQAGWLTWFRRPVLAAALTVLMGSWGGPVLLPRAAEFIAPAMTKSRSWILRCDRAGHGGERSAGFGKESRFVFRLRFTG